jgi:phenylpyruvate tautomerase PptA (4-oxalocrotonate tautomerase family)
MPLVTLTVRKPKSIDFKDAVLAGVHRALVASGVPAADLFQRILELDAEDFRFDPSYPDLSRPRTTEFVLIEILLSVGRTVKVKRQIVSAVVAELKANLGLDPEHIMICFVETRWENWSFAGGRLIHA